MKKYKNINDTKIVELQIKLSEQMKLILKSHQKLTPILKSALDYADIIYNMAENAALTLNNLKAELKKGAIKPEDAFYEHFGVYYNDVYWYLNWLLSRNSHGLVGRLNSMLNETKQHMSLRKNFKGYRSIRRYGKR